MARSNNRWFFALLLLTMAMLAFPSSSLAYQSGPKRQNTHGVISYSLDPANDANLKVSGSGNQIDAAAGKWNAASYFTLSNSGTYNGVRDMAVTTANFQNGLCGGAPNDGAAAVVCIVSSGNALTSTVEYFNNSPTYAWNTSGNEQYCANAPKPVDVYAIGLHEFGHWYNLADHPANHPEAVMNFDCNYKPNLLPDDKEGATQIYGPYTGFESSPNQAQGLVDTVDGIANVTGYYGSGNPQLGPVSQEPGAPVPAGSMYERMVGDAQTASYSAVYFRLFTNLNDSAPLNPPAYLTITQGMKLNWSQFNYQQGTMCLDFIMTDGSTLRDSGLVDNYGVRVHPAYRGGYGTGTWYNFSVDLSPLAGRTIRQWMIAYDNGQSHLTGQFRGFFDTVYVTY